MPQPLKVIKLRIRSVESTKKLTRAMELVSIAKLRRSDNALAAARQYYERIDLLLENIFYLSAEIKHPFLEQRQDERRIALFIVTSDTGLCSNYNHSIIRAAEGFLSGYEPDKVKLIILGKKGFTYFKKKEFNIAHTYLGLNGRYSKEAAREIFNQLTGLFLSKQVNQIYAVYHHLENGSRYNARVKKILNLEYKTAKRQEYILETPAGEIFKRLIPEYLLCEIRMIILNAFTAEHKARAIAMGEATKNAVELIEELVLLRNKIRQANITREMLEIISSAEALKG